MMRRLICATIGHRWMGKKFLARLRRPGWTYRCSTCGAVVSM